MNESQTFHKRTDTFSIIHKVQTASVQLALSTSKAMLYSTLEERVLHAYVSDVFELVYFATQRVIPTPALLAEWKLQSEAPKNAQNLEYYKYIQSMVEPIFNQFPEAQLDVFSMHPSAFADLCHYLVRTTAGISFVINQPDSLDDETFKLLCGTAAKICGILFMENIVYPEMSQFDFSSWRTKMKDQLPGQKTEFHDNIVTFPGIPGKTIH